MDTLAFLTQHGKLVAVQSPLLQAGFAVVIVEGFDTDTLGTFTGETARRGSQLDAATAKAKLAAELSGNRYGLGSEGSYGPDPYVGLTAWACEVLVWWDVQEQHAVFAVVQGAQTNYAQCTSTSWEQAKEFAHEAGFPEHGIIVGKPLGTAFSKTCTNWQLLEFQTRQALQLGPVWLETDMRAHRNPTRMALIGQCAQELAQLLQCTCPACNRGGFGQQTPIVGALCESCGFSTGAVRAKRIQCSACGYAQELLLQRTVPAARCERCNP